MNIGSLSSGINMQSSVQRSVEKPATGEPAHETAMRATADQQVEELSVKLQEMVNSGEASSDTELASEDDQNNFEKLAQRINHKLNQAQSNVVLDVDSELDHVFFIIKEKGSDRVLRKIPSEDQVKLAQSIKELQPGLEIQGLEIDAKY